MFRGDDMPFWTNSAARGGKAVPVSGTARSTTRFARPPMPAPGYARVCHIHHGRFLSARIGAPPTPIPPVPTLQRRPSKGRWTVLRKGGIPPHPGGNRRVKGKHSFIVPCFRAQTSRYHAAGRMGAPPHARPSPCYGICIPSPVYHGERGKGGK